MPRRDDTKTVDRLLEDVMARASDGLSFETASAAITDGVKAVAAQLEALAHKKYSALQAPEIARCASHTVKAMDELFRLLQFAKGAPDSRPDLGADWLRGLNEGQLRQVEAWIAEAARAGTEIGGH